jgi:hypothetical protein
MARKSIEPFIPLLRDVTYGLDGIMAVLGINGHGGIYMSARKLTKYRIHSSSTHLQLPYQEYAAIKRRHSTDVVKGAMIIAPGLKDNAAIKLNHERLSYYRLMSNVYRTGKSLGPGTLLSDSLTMATAKAHRREKLTMVMRSIASTLRHDYMSRRDYAKEMEVMKRRLEDA